MRRQFFNQLRTLPEMNSQEKELFRRSITPEQVRIVQKVQNILKHQINKLDDEESDYFLFGGLIAPIFPPAILFLCHEPENLEKCREAYKQLENLISSKELDNKVKDLQ